MKMIEVNLTKLAAEKYNLFNGKRELINKVLDGLRNNEITEDDLTKVFESKDLVIFTKECSSIFILLTKKKDEWVVLDFMPPEEYTNTFK